MWAGLELTIGILQVIDNLTSGLISEPQVFRFSRGAHPAERAKSHGEDVTEKEGVISDKTPYHLPHNILHITGISKTLIILSILPEQFGSGSLAFEQERVTVIPEVHSFG